MELSQQEVDIYNYSIKQNKKTRIMILDFPGQFLCHELILKIFLRIISSNNVEVDEQL